MADNVVEVQIRATADQYKATVAQAVGSTQDLKNALGQVAVASGISASAQEALAAKNQFASETAAEFVARINQEALSAAQTTVALNQTVVAEQNLGVAAETTGGIFGTLIVRAKELGGSFTEVGRHALEAGVEISHAMGEATASIARTAEATGLLSGKLSLAGAGGVLLGGTVLVEMVNVLGHVAKETQDTAIELSHMATAANISVESLGALRQTLEENAVPVEGLRMSVIRFDRAVEASAKGNERQQQALHQLGITSKDYIGALEQAAIHLQTSTNATQDNSNMMQVFGRSAISMIGFLKQTGDELGKNIDENRDYGRAMQEAAASALALTKIEKQAADAFEVLAANSLPAVLNGLKSVISAWIETRLVIREVIIVLEYWASTVANEVKGTYEILKHPLDFSAQQAALKDVLLKRELLFRDSHARMKEEQEKAAQDIARLWKAPIAVPPVAQETGDIEFGDSKAKLNKQRAIEEERLSITEKHQLELIAIEKQDIEAKRALEQLTAAEAFSAESDLNTRILALKQRFITAKLALYEKDPDAQKEVVKLQGDRVKAVDDAAKEEDRIRNKSLEEKKKLEDALVAAQRKADDAIEEHVKQLAEKDLEVQRKGLAEFSKLQKQLVEEDSKKAEAFLEAQLKQLKANEDLALSQAKLRDEPLAARIGIVNTYNAAIKKTIEEINALKLADAERKDAPLKEAGLPTPGVDVAKTKGTEDLAAQATTAQKQIQGIQNEMARGWEQVANKMTSSFDGAFRSVLQGTASIGGAFRQVAFGITIDIGTALLNVGVKWLESVAIRKASELGLSGFMAALHVGDAALARAIGAAAGAAQITTAAAVGAANAAAATAAIPFVGPELAPAAAAATFAEIISFVGLVAFEKGGVVGTNEVFAQLHPHEMVLPAPLSTGIQDIISTGGTAPKPDGAANPQLSVPEPTPAVPVTSNIFSDIVSSVVAASPVLSAPAPGPANLNVPEPPSLEIPAAAIGESTAGALQPREASGPGGVAAGIAALTESVTKIQNNTNAGHTFNLQYQGYQGQGADSMRRDGKEMIKQLNKALRNMNMPTLG